MQTLKVCLPVIIGLSAIFIPKVSAQEYCAFADKRDLHPVEGFKCRVIMSGSGAPENISFIDDYDNNKRYMVGYSEPFGEQINNFKYYGGIYGYRGNCMASPSFSKLVCWGGRQIK